MNLVRGTIKSCQVFKLTARTISVSASSSASEPPKEEEEKEDDPRTHYYPNTSVGIAERTAKADKKGVQPLQTPIPPFPGGKNPKTGEVGGPAGPEPTRFGDWERKGRVSDF